MTRIVSYRTKHFEFQVPIDEWNAKKIPLPEGVGAQFIAPSDLTAILLEPFYYDWSYETDGQLTGDSTLVYDEKWVGKEIRHFPWCKELFEAEAALLKPNGYRIPEIEEWRRIYDGLRVEYGKNDKVTSAILRAVLNLAFSGYVWRGDPGGVGSYGVFWSASEISAGSARCLDFNSDRVDPENWDIRSSAQSVRCVSESGSFPNS